MTKFCIITVAAKDNSGIRGTVASVDQQTVAPYRHILVVSQVPTCELESLPSRPYREIIRDQDRSLYNAMNIGLERASGDLVLFLNGGDLLYRKNSLEVVSRKWDGASIVSGRSVQIFGEHIYLRPRIGHLSDLLFSSPHQAFYTPLSSELPRYDETGRIGADSVWMDQVRKLHSQQLLSDVLCRFSLGGLSNSPTLKTVRRRWRFDGTRAAAKEAAKLLLHRSLGQSTAYRILYSKRFAHCRMRPSRRQHLAH